MCLGANNHENKSVISPIRELVQFWNVVLSPVCCSSRLPWEGPLLWPLLSAICCTLGMSTEVSQDRDCRSPGRSSTLSWEGSVVRSLQVRREGDGNELCGVNVAVSSGTLRSEGQFKSKHSDGAFLSLTDKTIWRVLTRRDGDESCWAELCFSNSGLSIRLNTRVI